MSTGSQDTDGNRPAGAGRLRSSGPLSRQDRAGFEWRDARLGFDPVQIGAVPQDVRDDLTAVAEGPKAGWPCVPSAAQRLTLRAWADTDAARFRDLLDDPSVWTHMPTARPDPFDLSVALTLIALSNDAGHHVVRAICLEGRPVGQVRLEHHASGAVELSYWIGREHRGQGVATRALTGFLAEHAPVASRLFARVHRDNPASARVLTKLGMAPEGSDPGDPDWMLFARTRR